MRNILVIVVNNVPDYFILVHYVTVINQGMYINDRNYDNVRILKMCFIIYL